MKDITIELNASNASGEAYWRKRCDVVEAELSSLRAVNAGLVEALHRLADDKYWRDQSIMRGAFTAAAMVNIARAALSRAAQAKPEPETCVWKPQGGAWFRDCARAISQWEKLPETCPACGKQIEVKR